MNPNHYPSLELCNKLTANGFPKTEYTYAVVFWEWILYRDDMIDYTRLSESDAKFYSYPSVMELLDFIRKKDISLNYNWTINFLSPELPDALSELILIYLQNENN